MFLENAALSFVKGQRRIYSSFVASQIRFPISRSVGRPGLGLGGHGQEGRTAGRKEVAKRRLIRFAIPLLAGRAAAASASATVAAVAEPRLTPAAGGLRQRSMFVSRFSSTFVVGSNSSSSSSTGSIDSQSQVNRALSRSHSLTPAAH